MAETSDAQGILHQNLLDAGCGEALMQQFLKLAAAGKTNAALSLLSQHRVHLLDCCHAEQKKLDCLDYLIYRMEKDEHK